MVRRTGIREDRKKNLLRVIKESKQWRVIITHVMKGHGALKRTYLTLKSALEIMFSYIDSDNYQREYISVSDRQQAVVINPLYLDVKVVEILFKKDKLNQFSSVCSTIFNSLFFDQHHKKQYFFHDNFIIFFC